jgi:hypothetical protein
MTKKISSFRLWPQFVEKSFRRAVIVETMRYDDENLELDGEKCFQVLSKLVSMSLKRFYFPLSVRN